MKNRKLSFLPGKIWLLLITFLLCIPGSNFPSSIAMEWLDKIWFDKWVHIFLFSILVFLFCWAEIGTHKSLSFYWISFAGIVYGILLELVQHFFIPSRLFEFGDIIADTLGCLLGLWLARKIHLKKETPVETGV